MSWNYVLFSCVADSMVDDYHSEAMESKRYSVDHSDTAFGVMTSPYVASKSTYGFRSGAAYSGGACRPAASPSAFQEGNRSGKRNQGWHGKDTVPKHVCKYLHNHMHRGTQSADSNTYILYMHVQKFQDIVIVITLSISLVLSYCFSPAYSPSPEAGESKPPPSKDPSRWSVEEVVWFIKDADPQALGPHVELFRKHVSVGCRFIAA